MEATLEAVKRNTFGRNENGRLRRDGMIPAVLYGGGSEGMALAVDPKSLSKILHSKSGANTLIALTFEGSGDTRVLVKEYQLEPVSHRLLHADFYKVAMDKALRVTVPVHLAGESKGVKAQGGQLARFFQVCQVAIATWCAWNASGNHSLACFNFVTHLANNICVRPDKLDTTTGTNFCQLWIFREKAISGMKRIAASCNSNIHNIVSIQIPYHRV